MSKGIHFDSIEDLDLSHVKYTKKEEEDTDTKMKTKIQLTVILVMLVS